MRTSAENENTLQEAGARLCRVTDQNLSWFHGGPAPARVPTTPEPELFKSLLYSEDQDPVRNF